jgi:hypothetical protein
MCTDRAVFVALLLPSSLKGRVGVLGNCCYFPADSVVLTCGVMVGRDGLSGWLVDLRWDDDLVQGIDP